MKKREIYQCFIYMKPLLDSEERTIILRFLSNLLNKTEEDIVDEINDQIHKTRVGRQGVERLS